MKIRDFIYDENIRILNLDKVENTIQNRLIMEAFCEIIDNENDNYLEKIKENIKKKKLEQLLDEIIFLMKEILESNLSECLMSSKWLREQFSLKELFNEIVNIFGNHIDAKGETDEDKFKKAVKEKGFSLEGEWEKPINNLSALDVKLKILKRFLKGMTLKNMIEFIKGKEFPVKELPLKKPFLKQFKEKYIHIFDYEWIKMSDLLVDDNAQDLKKDFPDEDLELEKTIYFIEDNSGNILRISSEGIIWDTQKEKYYQYQANHKTGKIELKYFEADSIEYLRENLYLVRKDKEHMYINLSNSNIKGIEEKTEKIELDKKFTKNGDKIIFYDKNRQFKFKVLREFKAYSQINDKMSYLLKDSKKNKYLLLCRKNSYILKKIKIDLSFFYIIDKKINGKNIEVVNYDIYGRKIIFKARKETIFEKGIVRDKGIIMFAQGLTENNKPKFLEVLKVTVKEKRARLRMDKGYENKLVVENKAVYIIFYNKGYTVLNFSNQYKKNNETYYRYEINKICIRGKNSEAPFVLSHIYIKEYIYSNTGKKEKYHFLEQQLSTEDLNDIKIDFNKGNILFLGREFKNKDSYEQAIKTGENREDLLKKLPIEKTDTAIFMPFKINRK